MVIYGIRLEASSEYRYVGLTTKTAQERLRSHIKRTKSKSLRNYPVNDWIEKHLDDRVVVDVLEDLSGRTMEDLCDAEIFWIFALRYLGHRLLNAAEGGSGPNGYRHTEETKRRISELHKGNKYSLGRPGDRRPKHSDEQKKAWSEQRKGSITGEKNPNWGKFGDEHPSYGRVWKPESIEKCRQSKLGSNNPNYGKTMSEDQRRKISESSKGVPKPSSRRSAHTRHHTNKGVSKPETCKYCREDELPLEPCI